MFRPQVRLSRPEHFSGKTDLRGDVADARPCCHESSGRVAAWSSGRSMMDMAAAIDKMLIRATPFTGTV